MDAPSGQTQVADKLAQDLNDLLASLSLPVTVETPYDLTPCLLIVILESILRSRLPISTETRESRTSAAKIEAMKVFLGVLEYDVLRTDIGLSEIDPRRLAVGEWDEVLFVGETLCWLGHREGFASTSDPHVLVASSSTVSRANTSVDTGFSRYDTSETTATTLPSFDAVAETPSAPIEPPSPPLHPRCIHEVEASFSFDIQSTDDDDDEEEEEGELCDCSFQPSFDADAGLCEHPHVTATANSLRAPVRYDGLIHPVDDEIEDFEASRERTRFRADAKTSNNSQATPRHPSSLVHNPTRHTSPTQHTLLLLNERARLLEELARLKIARLPNR